ncbi:hypothetical protein TPR58_22365 [Sphingomonas sp. HF-S3]|uniref:Uncharacterized protein n=1 Tax=Sphingomonas rustica TaxID=3103142 RepID=A0ABV0BEF6_9SPHN
MQFKQFYELVLGKTLDKPLGFEFLREAIDGGLNDVQEVKVWRQTYHPPKREAHFMLFDDRTSAYDGEFLVADISYCSALDHDPAELLFALTKELMHVFDPVETRIDSREKFVKFLKDLQNAPLDKPNLAIDAENRARWMAILVLCPKPLRDSIAAEIAEGRAIRPEVAQRFGLPDWLIEVALDDYYDEAVRILTVAS